MPPIDADIPCARCGQSLRGTELRQHCPGCGTAVAMSVNPSVVDQADLTVRGDLPCVHCDYNLRTMPIGSRCPECGQTVADSLRSRSLALASWAWLGQLRKACTTFLIGCFGFLAALLLLQLFDRFEPTTACVLSIPAVLAAVVCPFAMLVETIEFCTPEPGQPSWSSRIPLDTFARGFLILAFVCLGLLMWRDHRWLGVYLPALCLLTGILCAPFAALRLGRRAGDILLSGLAIVWMLAMMFCTMLLIMWSLDDLLASPMTTGSGFLSFIGLMGSSYRAVLATCSLAAITMLKCRRTLIDAMASHVLKMSADLTAEREEKNVRGEN